mmetsp:Transcript_14719/g.46318  ORF Transcript_14719/g.46318 Transcript_14719/m.46318 type:complete len:339 (-) Transcript_14719:23-1039(-)
MAQPRSAGVLRVVVKTAVLQRSLHVRGHGLREDHALDARERPEVRQQHHVVHAEAPGVERVRTADQARELLELGVRPGQELRRGGQRGLVVQAGLGRVLPPRVGHIPGVRPVLHGHLHLARLDELAGDVPELRAELGHVAAARVAGQREAVLGDEEGADLQGLRHAHGPGRRRHALALQHRQHLLAGEGHRPAARVVARATASLWRGALAVAIELALVRDVEARQEDLHAVAEGAVVIGVQAVGRRGVAPSAPHRQPLRQPRTQRVSPESGRPQPGRDRGPATCSRGCCLAKELRHGSALEGGAGCRRHCSCYDLAAKACGEVPQAGGHHWKQQLAGT